MALILKSEIQEALQTTEQNLKQIPIDKTIFQYVANFFARIEYVIDDVNGNSREAKVDASDRMNEIIRDLLEKMQSHGVKSFLEKKDEIPGLGSEQIDQECVVEKTRDTCCEQFLLHSDSYICL